MHITIKKDTIALWIVIAGIVIAEIGNAYLTYNWNPNTYITDGIDSYTYNDFYDALGDIILKLAAIIVIRMYVTNRILKNVLNFYIEALLIDLVYSTFFNPFIYHLSKTQLIEVTFVVYLFQILFYKTWQRLFSPNFNKRKIKIT